MFIVLKYNHCYVEAIFEGGYEDVNSGLVINLYLHQYILFWESEAIHICSRCPLYQLIKARLTLEKAVKFY
jgi:hypothetical protein